MARLLILSGMASSGKSSCAKMLVEKSKKPIVPIDPDILYMPVIGWLESSTPGDHFYRLLQEDFDTRAGGQKGMLEQMEQAVFGSIKWMLEANNDVLLLHALLYYIHNDINIVERFQDFLGFKHKVEMVWLDVEEESLRQRMHKRASVWDHKTLMQWEYYSNLKKGIESQDCIRLNNPDGQQEQTVKELLRIWNLNKE